MKTAIVTSSDKKYLPGVKALYSSFVLNNKYETDFIVFAHGDEKDFKDLDRKGIRLIFNRETVDSPRCKLWPVKLPAMYSRLLIPKILSDYDRVLFLDADTLILKDLKDLFYTDLDNNPCAGITPGNNANIKQSFIPWQLEDERDFPDLKTTLAIQVGVMLIDPKKWLELELDVLVDNLLLLENTFKFAVQGVIGVALKGRFKTIDLKWHGRVSKTSSLENCHILHYTMANPWEGETKFKETWEYFYRRF